MGDAAQLGILIGFYQQKMGIETEKDIVIQVQDSEVLTLKLQKILFLKSNDPSFKLFPNTVDSIVKEAILDIYGNFSEFTTPIITQTML